jgi:hypothetical protein
VLVVVVTIGTTRTPQAIRQGPMIHLEPEVTGHGQEAEVARTMIKESTMVQ